MCIYRVQYEWDKEKNRRNQRNHGGISFELAGLVFQDERCLIGLDRIDETGEQRWYAIGAAHIKSAATVVLLVVHAYREDCHGEEIIRIPERAAIGISARRAEKHEIRRYQKQAMD